MDPKLYKTLKQLIKLGILTKNTRVVRRRRKRNGKTSQSTRSVYRIQQNAQPTDHLKSNATTTYTTPTIQSEQAIVNLKSSELQLEKALTNKNLPDDTQNKIILALGDVQNQISQYGGNINKRLNDQQQTIHHNYNYMNYSNTAAKYEGSDTKRRTPDKSQYDSFVPQTKSNQNMSTNMGISGSTPQKDLTASEYINNTPPPAKKAIKWVIKPEESESESEPESESVHPEPVKEPVAEPVKEPVAEPVKEPVAEPVKEPEAEALPTKRVSTYAKNKPIVEKLRAEYADFAMLANAPVKQAPKHWTKRMLEDNIHDLKVVTLKRQYRDAGGSSKTYLAKTYDNVQNLELAVKQLMDSKNKYAD
jgi:hypothetical protein